MSLMKSFHWIWLALIISSLTPYLLQAQTNNYLNFAFDNPKLKSEFLLYLAKNYSSNAYSILNKKTYDYYIGWVTGKGHYRVLSSYAVVVHETCHLINEDIGGFWSKGYYISPKIEIEVSTTRIFKSNELNNMVPSDWKNKIFRYDAYINGTGKDKEIASVAEGIYGLMDEFDAYYQSTRAVVELYGYYKTFAGYTEPYYWTLYLSNCYSSIFAYYEFRLFIAWYLKYARKNYPEIYQGIIQNKKLKAAFTLIDISYEKVVKQYFENRKIILENINKAGRKKAEISDNYFIIVNKNQKGGTSKGYGIPDSEITYLKSLFTLEDFQLLKLFSIENLNETNYEMYFN